MPTSVALELRSCSSNFNMLSENYRRFSGELRPKRVSPDESKVLHNFLQKMKNLGVISQPPEASRGEYAFTSELYSLFFWLQATTEKRS
jgi:hypothetical protein